MHADPVATFNTRLAHAKIHALQLLLDLTTRLTDPDAVTGDEIRELRLAATAILRTQPMKESPRSASPEPPRGATHAPEAQNAPSSPSPPIPAYRSNLNPTCRSARADIRRLLKEGIPEIVELFPDGLPPFEPRLPRAGCATRAPPGRDTR